jgi:hypothetical protein
MCEPLYARILGEAFEQLPQVTRRLHSPDPQRVYAGHADIRRGSTLAARLVAALLDLPRPGHQTQSRVTVRREGEAEILTRDYGGRIFESWQGFEATPDGPRLIERIGPVATRLRLEASSDGLDFHAEAARWRGVPLPGWLVPRVTARERADGDAHLFDVAVSLPLMGEIIGYRGRLVEIAG